MGEIFLFSFNAVMPILLLVFLGWFLRVIHFADDGFFKKANTMVFKIFLPVLLFVNIYEIDSLKSLNFKAVIYCVAAILLIFFCGYIVAHIVTDKRSYLGVLAQCSFRSNYAIIGIPLALSLGGEEAVAFASVLSAVAVPLFNVLAVILLSHYSKEKEDWAVRKTLLRTAKNPLIIGVFIGIGVLAVRSFIPLNESGVPVFTIEGNIPFFYKALKNLASVASPLALVVLGARFDFKAVGSLRKEIAVGTLMRVVMAPLIGLGGAIMLSELTDIFSFTATEYPAFISLFATPTAVSSAVMVGEIGGDEQLAGQLVVWTSVVSMLTIYVIVFAMKSFAII
ncbi:MAG: AEC family transporter [Clostridia bacterium]|nr:AEC family transporter [Clostridia bacterium]